MWQSIWSCWGTGPVFQGFHIMMKRSEKWFLFLILWGIVSLSRVLYPYPLCDQSAWDHTNPSHGSAVLLDLPGERTEHHWPWKYAGKHSLLSAGQFWTRAGPGFVWSGGADGESRLCLRLASWCCIGRVHDIFGKLWCVFQMGVLVGCEHISCHCCTRSLMNSPVPRHAISQHQGGLSSSWPRSSLADPVHLPEVSARILFWWCH